MDTHEQSQAQTTQENIYLEHRLIDGSRYDASSHLHLADAVNNMTHRARSVLIMLSSQFVEADNNRLNDDIIYNVIESVLQEIDYINTVVNAYHKAQQKPTNTNLHA